MVEDESETREGHEGKRGHLANPKLESKFEGVVGICYGLSSLAGSKVWDRRSAELEESMPFEVLEALDAWEGQHELLEIMDLEVAWHATIRISVVVGGG